MIKTCFIFILALDYLENLEVSSSVSDNKFDDNVKSACIYIQQPVGAASKNNDDDPQSKVTGNESCSYRD